MFNYAYHNNATELQNVYFSIIPFTRDDTHLVFNFTYIHVDSVDVVRSTGFSFLMKLHTSFIGYLIIKVN